MKNITISAPGKLLLFGDHAVVYGHPCIVTAISQRLSVSVSLVDDVSGDRRFVDAAIDAWGSGASCKFSIKSAFAPTYGLGSSSAVTVATLKALRPDADNRTLFDAAYKIVLDIQGVGSGFDVAAAVYGGTLFYTKGKPVDTLTVKSMPLIVGYSGVKADTVILINDVVKKRKMNPEKVDRIFAACAQLTNQAKIAMEESDWKRVGKLMDFNQEYLRDLGVSSEKLEALISAAKNAGAYGAKLSGAGGGDCMIALAPEDKRKAVEDAIALVGGQVIHIAPGAQGVRIEA